MLKKIALIASYVLVAVVIAGGTLLLVSYGQGYSYDFRNHKFVSNGLLILGSTPSGAILSIDGRQTRRDTPFRSTFRVGSYDLKLTKDGYRGWQKRVEIVASEVVNLASIILVPDVIKSKAVDASKSTVSLISSSDRKHVAYITGDKAPGLWRLNAGDAIGTKVYTPAPASDSSPAHAIESGTLSRDGSRALLRVRQADGIHMLYVNMGNGNTQDLSTTFKSNFDDLRFSFNDANQLYWLSNGELRRVDVNARTMSAVLADKVAAYTYDGSRVLYVQGTDVGNVLKVMDGDGRNSKTLVQGLANSNSYLLSFASYRGKEVLGVVPASNGQLTVYEGIYSENPVGRLVARDITRLLASDDGHYIVFARDKGFGSYDTGRARINDGLYKDKIDAISWFNGAHVIVNSGDKTRFVEFDGGNSADIGTSAPIASFGMHDERRIVYVDAKTGQVTVADLRK